MKKAAVIIGGILLFFLVLYLLQTLVRDRVINDFSHEKSKKSSLISPTPYKKVQPTGQDKVSEFVPYWTLGQKIDSDGNELIYFGIAAGQDGINREDEGFRRLPQFVSQAGERQKILTLRMLDQEISSNVIENKSMQDKLISETLDVAKSNGFEGVVLDLELKALPFDSVIQNINTFVTSFNKQAKEEGLSFSVLVYGDTFYRVRPYDIKTLAKNSDEIMIMAYDFHKAGGSPGPNFPLRGSAKYGYDFQEMISDFLRVVPKEKLTVVFGMFGYDWEVRDGGESTGPAQALSLSNMTNRFLKDCAFSECSVRRDGDAGETMVEYVEQGSRHVVWFEDKESVRQKQAFLKDRGINSFSYWAYSFFD